MSRVSVQTIAAAHRRNIWIAMICRNFFVKDDESPFLNFKEVGGMPKFLLGVNPQGGPYVSSRGAKEIEGRK